MIYFIVNPVSGSGKAAAAVPIVDRLMGESGRDYIFIYSESDKDYARIAGLINLDKAKALICVGGDGTIQQYCGLAIGRDLPFGVIPAGSGNDLLYSLPGGEKKFTGFEEKITFYTQKVLKGSTIPIDAVAVNGDNYFVNIGGAGMDIQVLMDAIPLKKYFGGASYFLSLIKNAFLYKEEVMKLTVDGRSETGRFLLLAVCNGAYYGGHMRIAPPASLDDGYITFCKVTNMPRLKLMVLFPSVKSGKHAQLKEVSFVNCSSVTMEFDGVKTINFDGNLLEFGSPLTFEIRKGALRFIL